MEMKFDNLAEKNRLQEKNNFKYENGGDKSDCYIVDLENFCNGGVDKLEQSINSSTITTNSRITFQRSLSRKVPHLRGAEKKINDRDITTLPPSSSPRAVQVVSTPEKYVSPPTISVGSQDHTMNNHHQVSQHQITIKTGGINTIADGRWGRRSSFKRSSYTWFSDPKRVLLFFATLSCMGTMLLIFFTLSVSKANNKESALDWQ